MFMTFLRSYKRREIERHVLIILRSYKRREIERDAQLAGNPPRRTRETEEKRRQNPVRQRPQRDTTQCTAPLDPDSPILIWPLTLALSCGQNARRFGRQLQCRVRCGHAWRPPSIGVSRCSMS